MIVDVVPDEEAPQMIEPLPFKLPMSITKRPRAKLYVFRRCRLNVRNAFFTDSPLT